jgi:hypothetical protein
VQQALREAGIRAAQRAVRSSSCCPVTARAETTKEKRHEAAGANLSGLQIRGSKFRSSSSKFRELELANFRARSRLYRSQILQVNMRFAAFFKIYQIIKLKNLKFGKILQILRHLQKFNFAEIFSKIADFSNQFFSQKILILGS